jgi:hypothetical protein
MSGVTALGFTYQGFGGIENNYNMMSILIPIFSKKTVEMFFGPIG